MAAADPPRHVWATPCLTYVEHREDLEMWRGGCLYHRGRSGPDRRTPQQAQEDCTRHLHVQLRATPDAPGQLPLGR